MDDETDRTSQASELPEQPKRGSRSGGLPAWATALATFVAGLLLGGLVVALAQNGSEETPRVAGSVSPSPSSSPSTSPTPSGGDVLVRVPGSCVQVAEKAETAVQGFDDLAAATRDFDARELQSVVDRLQKLRPQIEALSAQCRDAAGQGLTEGDLASPAPVPSP